MKNKGFTLVEILVTVALLAIVGGAITSFIVVTQKNYGTGVVQTDQQTKAQLIANQLEDIMIEATSITATTSTSTPAVEGDPVVTTTKLEIYGNDEESHADDYEVYWYSDSQTLTYNYLGSAEVAALLAEGVSQFSVDVTSLDRDNTVWFYFTLTSGDASNAKLYSTSHKVKLRNEVMVAVEEETLPTTTESNVTLTVGPHPLYVWPATTNALSAVVTITEGGVSSTPMGLQSVIWTPTGHTDPTTKVVNSTNAFTLGENERGTDDIPGGDQNLITLTASKELDDGTTKSASLTAHVREITNIEAHDTLGHAFNSPVSAGIAGVEEGDIWKIMEGKKTTISTDIIGINLKDSYGNDLTYTEKGGLDVEIVDPQHVVKDYSYNRNLGEVEIEVNEFATFPATAPTFQVKMQCRQTPFQYVTLTITYTLEEKPDVVADVGDGTIGRTGEINVDFSGLNMENLEEYPRAGSGKWRFKNGQVINLYFTYHYLGGGTLNDTMGNQGTYGRWQDTNQLFELWFEEGNPTKLKLKLKPNGHAFSTPYSLGATNCYYWNAYSNVTSVDVLVDFAGYQKSKFTLTWEDVAFEYNVASPSDAEGNARWKTAVTWKANHDKTSTDTAPWSDTEIIYVTANDYVTTADSNNSRKYKFYYMYPEGWDGASYELDTTRYVAISDNGKNLTSKFAFSTGKDTKNNYYVSIPALSNETVNTLRTTDGVKYIDLVYEGNPFLGDPALQTSEFKSQYESITGCRGIVRIMLVDSNVHRDFHNEPDLKSAYCPTYDYMVAHEGEFEKASNGYYHYIDESTRYWVYMSGDKAYAVYQTGNTNGSWSNDLTLIWKGLDGTEPDGWYDYITENVYTYLHKLSKYPSPAYCLTFSELKNMGKTPFTAEVKDNGGKLEKKKHKTVTYEYMTENSEYVFWVQSDAIYYGKLDKNKNVLNVIQKYSYLDSPYGNKVWYDFTSNNIDYSSNSSLSIGSLPVSQRPSVYYCPSYSDCYYEVYSDVVEEYYDNSLGYYYYYYFNSDGWSDAAHATEVFAIYRATVQVGTDWWGNPRYETRYYAQYFRRNPSWEAQYKLRWNSDYDLWQLTND